MTEVEIRQQTNRYFEIDNKDLKDREDFEEMEQIAIRLMRQWSRWQNVYRPPF